MDSIFKSEDLTSLKQRIDTLNPESQRQWGKMEVAQMMAHCQAPLNVGTGSHELKKYNFIIRLIGKMVKNKLMKDDLPFKKNQPTDKTFLVSEPRKFEEEKKKLLSAIDKFSEAGKTDTLHKRHPFFGPLTNPEWDKLQMKHLDHHLRQFGA